MWANAAFGMPFNFIPKGLNAGVQTDSSSCGICAMNTIDHAINGTKLFTMETRAENRIKCFLQAMTFVDKHVSPWPSDTATLLTSFRTV